MLSLSLILHALWVAWMILGIVLAIVAYWRPRLWYMPIFRTTHLIGLVLTATVPFWNNGICPITNWETRVDELPNHDSDSFMIRLIRSVLYLDVAPWILSLTTAVLTIYCIAVYFIHPPWRKLGHND